MLTYRVLDKAAYNKLIGDLIKVTESLHAKSQDIGDNRATIGYGYTFNRNDNVEIWRASGIVLTDPQWALLTLVDKAAPEKKTALALQFDLVLDAATGDKLLSASITKYEVFAINLGMPLSYERAALTSLTYNRGIGSVDNNMQPFLNAIIKGNRAEAWFEMRYNSWGSASKFEAGLRARRLVESQIFGLYNDGSNVTPAEAKEIFEMFEQNRDRILADESRWGVNPDGSAGTRNLIAQDNADSRYIPFPKVQTVNESLKLAQQSFLADLRNQYPALTPYLQDSTFVASNIYVAKADRWDSHDLVDQGVSIDSSAYEKKYWPSGVSDLIVGSDFADFLASGQGNDVVIAGDGDDVLEGGGGDDVLVGGKGNDLYVWNSGDGSDKIIEERDADGKIHGKIRINNGAAQDLMAQGVFIRQGTSNIWKSPDGKITLSHNSPWKITASDGATIQLGEGQNDFQDGDYGISLVGPVVNNIVRTISGDKDFGTNSDARDDLGNPVGNSEPGRGDSLMGASTDDRILGLAGKDLIQGLAGNDIIEGGADSDILIGGAGNDQIFADVQIDVASAISGTGNNPTATGSRGDWIDGGDGTDILVGGVNNDVLMGGHGKDILVGGSGDDILDGDDDYIATVINDGTSYDIRSFDWQVSGQPNGNPFGFFIGPFYLASPPDGDNDELHGGAGNDKLLGLKGDDLLYGDEGNDTLSGGDDNDTLFGGDGNDIMSGEGGQPINNDGTVVVQGDDFLDGGAGNDWMEGGGGNDQLFGGDGDDEIYGDIKSYNDPSTSGNDLLDGGNGNDSLYGQGGDDDLFGGAGDDYLFGDSEATPTAQQGNDYLNGGDGDDYLRGYGGNDILVGGDGKDQLLAEDGNDYLDGGAGNDILDAGAGDDTAFGGDGNDSILGGEGNDVLNGGAGNDVISGGAGNDRLNGGDGNDTLLGGDGVDTFTGSAGIDILNGEAGNDIYDLSAETGLAIIQDKIGANILITSSRNFVESSPSPNMVVASGARPSLMMSATRESGDVSPSSDGIQDNAMLTTALDEDGKQIYIVGAKYENRTLTGGTILANGVEMSSYQFGNGSNYSHSQLLGISDTAVRIRLDKSATFDGMAGSDLIIGADDVTAGDHLNGNGGADKIYGRSGDDTISGGAGSDSLFGDDGDDTIIGDTGNDYLEGGSGDDTYLFNSGDGSDTVSDFNGNNRVRFGDGISVTTLSLSRTGSDLTLNYGNGDSILFKDGLDGSFKAAFDFSDGSTMSLSQILAHFNISIGEVSDGGVASNVLIGTAASENLVGTNADDVLIGNAGNDTLQGGGGADVYVLNLGDGADVIDDQANDINTVQFGAGITPYSISAHQRIDADGTEYLVVQYGQSGDEVAIKNGFSGAVQSFYFDTWGRSLSYDEVIERYVWDPVVLKGTTGDDILAGTTSDDRFESRGGNDTLIGKSGSDTYVLDHGGGQDIIIDTDNAQNRIVLGAGINFTDLDLTKSSDDLLVSIKGSNDQFLVKNYFSFSDGWTVQTADGASKTVHELPITVPGAPEGDVAARVQGYENKFYDTVRGDESAHNITPGSLNFSTGALTSDAANIYGVGASGIVATTISAGKTATVKTGPVTTTTTTPIFRQISSDDALLLYGANGSANLPAGAVPVYGPPITGPNGGSLPANIVGYTIPNGVKTTTSTKITTTVTIQDVLIEKTLTSVSVETIIGGDSDNHIHLIGANNTPNALGSSNAPYISISHKIIDGGAGNDVIGDGAFQNLADDFGGEGTDFSANGGWFQSIFGHQAKPGNFLYGNTGDDTLLGGYVADTLLGGAGNDLMNGRQGSDTYIVMNGADQGWDTIFDSGYSNVDSSGNLQDYGYGGAVPTDTVVFEAGIKLQDMQFTWGTAGNAEGRDTLDISWGQGTGIHVVLPTSADKYNEARGQYLGGVGIEQFQFSDGTVLSMAQMIALAPSYGVNVAPVLINPISNQDAFIGKYFNYSVPADVFSDANKYDKLTYSAKLADGGELPAWLTFNPDFLTFEGVPDGTNLGTLNISVTATDRHGLAASDLFSLAVQTVPNTAPVVSYPINYIDATEDEPLNYVVPWYAFTDYNEGDKLSYQMTLANGDPLPEWLSFDPATSRLTGLPGNDQVGEIPIRLLATDTGGLTAEQLVTLVVNNVNDAPVAVGTLAAQQLKKDQAFSYQIPDSAFLDIDAWDGRSYTASLADGSDLPSWLYCWNGSLTGTPGAEDIGTLTVQIKAWDYSGAFATQDIVLNISDGIAPENLVRPSLAARQSNRVTALVNALYGRGDGHNSDTPQHNSISEQLAEMKVIGQKIGAQTDVDRADMLVASAIEQSASSQLMERWSSIPILLSSHLADSSDLGDELSSTQNGAFTGANGVVAIAQADGKESVLRREMHNGELVRMF